MSAERPDAITSCDACLARRAFLAAAVRSTLTMAIVGIPESLFTDKPFGDVEALFRDDQTVRYAVPDTDGVTIDRKEQVILVRHSGHVFAFNLACPHQNTALRWVEKEQVFQCPRHKSRYQPDGTFTSGRATRGMDRFAVRKLNEQVEVSLDRVFRQDEDPAGWASAVLAIAGRNEG